MTIVSAASLGFWSALAVMSFIAVFDLLYSRVRNWAVLALTACYLLYATALPVVVIFGDLTAGVLLFGLSVAVWLIGKIGAGDAKFSLPLGLFVGWSGLPAYAILLLALSLVFLFLLHAGNSVLGGRGAVGERIGLILSTGRVPYAVPMAISGCVVLATRGVT